MRQALAFGNRYAGWHRSPRSAPGAWLVLGRFEGSTDWRRLHTLAKDNWGMFLRQIDPSGSSAPEALVGDPASRFGLAARRLLGEAAFDLDDGLAAAVRDVQLDLFVTVLESSGAVAVEVDQNGALQDLVEQDAESQRGWRTARYRIEEPAFSGGADGETDLVLAVQSGEPIVHRIELRRTDLAAPSDGGASPVAGGAAGVGGGGGAVLPGDGGDDAGGCGSCRVGREAWLGSAWPWLGLLLVGRGRRYGRSVGRTSVGVHQRRGCGRRGGPT